MPFDARGQIAIITGSAQGFGKEFAKRLLKVPKSVFRMSTKKLELKLWKNWRKLMEQKTLPLKGKKRQP